LRILVAGAAGAHGVRLGLPFSESGEDAGPADSGVGDEAEVDFMESAVGLIGRALLLWLLLFGLANLVGG
jgi:adenosylcobinamide-phosphate synthase